MNIINSLKDAFANLGKANYGDAFRPYYQLEQEAQVTEVADCPKKEYDPDMQAKAEELRKIAKQLSRISKRLEKIMSEE